MYRTHVWHDSYTCLKPTRRRMSHVTRMYGVRDMYRTYVVWHDSYTCVVPTRRRERPSLTIAALSPCINALYHTDRHRQKKQTDTDADTVTDTRTYIHTRTHIYTHTCTRTHAHTHT